MCSFGNNSHENGFTLIEILLILTLLVFLVHMVGLSYNPSKEKILNDADSANIRLIEGAVELYKLDTGKVPTKIEDLITEPNGVKFWRGPYLDYIPETLSNSGTRYQLNDKGKVIEK